MLLDFRPIRFCGINTMSRIKLQFVKSNPRYFDFNREVITVSNPIIILKLSSEMVKEKLLKIDKSIALMREVSQFK